MARALIGHTGFVGGHLLRRGGYSDVFNSSNVEELAGRSFERVVSAGCRAAKWLANREPEADRAGVQRLMRALERVQAERFVLISTVDVYPSPVGVDERDEPDERDSQPYGRHRLELERFVRERFPGALILRLPGLFGQGLKKNVIYDLLNDNRLDLVHQDGRFQFYDLDDVADDLERCLAAELELVHLATEPVTTLEVAREAFGREFANTLPLPGPRYDLRTVHARQWGRTGPYIAGREHVLARIRRFVERERAALR